MTISSCPSTISTPSMCSVERVMTAVKPEACGVRLVGSPTRTKDVAPIFASCVDTYEQPTALPLMSKPQQIYPWSSILSWGTTGRFETTMGNPGRLVGVVWHVWVKCSRQYHLFKNDPQSHASRELDGRGLYTIRHVAEVQLSKSWEDGQAAGNNAKTFGERLQKHLDARSICSVLSV